jgi:cobyric acid synthase
MKTALMVWGASSGAGKSRLATAQCRWAAREGLRVEPEPSGLAGQADEMGELGWVLYFQALAGVQWPGCEIRCGRTTATPAGALPAPLDAEGVPVGWCGGSGHNVLGIATHGLFEDAASLRALPGQQVRTLDQSFDGLADLIDNHLGAATLRALLKA